MTETRLLTEKDESVLYATLSRDPFYNLFMIGDLETMGWGDQRLWYWGQFSPTGELLGVAMRYRVNWCFYAGSDCDQRPFTWLVDDYADSQVVNGHPENVDPIIARLERYGVRELHTSYYCRMALDTGLPHPTWPTRRASAADLDALAELYATAGFMRRNAEDLGLKLAQGCRIAMTEVDGQIVSAALTSIETKYAAMVGGVFTPEPLRERGYASAAMTHLCADLMADGKQPCLFYDNPAAGSIYRRLGFEDIGPWHMVLLRPAVV